jgi:dihydrofolate synthase/folylpolyglutamate synthase
VAETEGLAYLRTFPDFEAGTGGGSLTLGLDRVLALLEEVGSPHLRLPVVHLAGTKGKGSTAAMLASICRVAGYRTGLFTQPHLVRLHERFLIDGDEIRDDAISAIMLDRIRPAVERLAARGIGGVQQFEAQVALALLWFEVQKVDIVVLETGLGGRLDATNVVPLPLATVLTPIGHDHMALLGDTLTAIAGEKAAIIKEGVPAVSSPQAPEAAVVFEAVSAERYAPLLLGGRDWSTDEVRATRQGTGFTLQIDPSALAHLGGVPAGGWDTDPHGVLRIEGLFTPLLGAHQAANAGAAAVAALVAASHLPRIGVEAIRRGLESVRWAGRLQVIAGSPPLVVDGAHTAESADALAQAMRSLFPGERIVLICGAQADKDIPAIVAPLAELAAVAVATQAQHPRAAPAAIVAAALRAAGCPDVREAPTVEDALALARSLSGSGDLILGTGSLYVAGELLAVSGR